MNRKLIFPLLLALPLFLALILLNLNTPTAAQAGPLAGFTPAPPNPPPGGNDDDNDDDGGTSTPSGPTSPDSSQPDEGPTDYVYVQLDRCDLICAADVAHKADRPVFQSLAAANTSEWSGALLVPVSPEASTVEVLTPVHLVHQGSGWISEAVLSNLHSSRVPVPYPGQWEVWLVESPELITADPFDPSTTNLSQLQTTLANGAVSLGIVQANTTEPQLIACPIACVIETPAGPQISLLPESGGDQAGADARARRLIFGGLTLIIVGLAWGFIIRPIFRPQPPHDTHE